MKKLIIYGFILSVFGFYLIGCGGSSAKDNKEIKGSQEPKISKYIGEFKLDDNATGISDGYGAFGDFEVQRLDTYEVLSDTNVTIYKPNFSITKPIATIFFISGWGQPDTSYEKHLKFLATQGYMVIDIYRDKLNYSNIEKSYADILFAIEKVVEDNPKLIDTKKIGLSGHSYGAGATVWLGYKLFVEKHWGEEGRFIVMNNPWYPFMVTKDNLKKYPSDTKLLVLFSDNEYDLKEPKSDIKFTTDPRAIRAVYKNISIGDDDKDFVLLKNSDNYSGIYKANHVYVYTNDNYNLLDVLIPNRFTHAMASLVFESDNKAKEVVLGNGSKKQITLSDGNTTLNDMILKVMDKVKFSSTKPSSIYRYPCPKISGEWSDIDEWKLFDECGE